MNSQLGDPDEPHQSPSDAGGREESEPRARWKEYPIGATGEAAQATLSIAVPLGIGIVLTFIFDLLMGFLYEEDIIYDVLSNAGMTSADWEPISTAIDYSTRMSLFPILVLAYVVVLGGSICGCVTDIATSRGLVKAIHNGASRREVPPPAQIESVIATRFGALWAVLLWSGIGLAFFGIIALIMAANDNKPIWALYGVLLLATGGVFGLAMRLTETKLHRPTVVAARSSLTGGQPLMSRGRGMPRGNSRVVSTTVNLPQQLSAVIPAWFAL